MAPDDFVYSSEGTSSVPGHESRTFGPPPRHHSSLRDLSCHIPAVRLGFNAPKLTMVPDAIHHTANINVVWVAGYGELFHANTQAAFHLSVHTVSGQSLHDGTNNEPLIDANGNPLGAIDGESGPVQGWTVSCPNTVEADGTITVTPENYSPHNSVSLDTLPGSC